MNDTMNWLGSVRTRAIALLGLVFAIGVLAGAGVFALGVHHMRRPRPPIGMMAGDPLHNGQLPPGFDRLGLSDDQKTRILAILKGARPRTDSILNDAMPRLRAITDSVRREIHKVLTPAQLEELMRDRRAHGLGPDDHPEMGGVGGPAPGRGAPPPDGPPPPDGR